MSIVKDALKKILRPVAARLYVFARDSARISEEAAIRARYDIHPTVTWQEGTYIFGAGHIKIGEGTYLGHNCHLSSHPAEARIVIGTGCALGHSIHIRTTNYARLPEFSEARKVPSDWADIIIGDDVWIGSHVYINAGVTVGSNSIIGANSVVTRSVPPNSVVGGVPARVLHDKSAYATRKPGIHSAAHPE